MHGCFASPVVISESAKQDFFENALWVLTSGEPSVSILERQTTSAMEVVKLICSRNEVVREVFYWSTKQLSTVSQIVRTTRNGARAAEGDPG